MTAEDEVTRALREVLRAARAATAVIGHHLVHYTFTSTHRIEGDPQEHRAAAVARIEALRGALADYDRAKLTAEQWRGMGPRCPATYREGTAVVYCGLMSGHPALHRSPSGVEWS